MIVCFSSSTVALVEDDLLRHRCRRKVTSSMPEQMGQVILSVPNPINHPLGGSNQSEQPTLEKCVIYFTENRILCWFIYTLSPCLH